MAGARRCSVAAATDPATWGPPCPGGCRVDRSISAGVVLGRFGAGGWKVTDTPPSCAPRGGDLARRLQAHDPAAGYPKHRHAVLETPYLNSAAPSTSPFPIALFGADSHPGPRGLALCVLNASMLAGRSPRRCCRWTFRERSQLMHFPCSCLTPRASSPAPAMVHTVSFSHTTLDCSRLTPGDVKHLLVLECAARHSRPLPECCTTS